MKKLLLIFVALMLAGCVAFPVNDYGYNYPYYGSYYWPYYGSYPFGYVRSDINFFYPGFYGGNVFRGDGHNFRGGDHGFRGGDNGFRGGDRGFRGGDHGGEGRH